MTLIEARKKVNYMSVNHLDNLFYKMLYGSKENIPKEIDLFLVEINLAAAEKLKRNYRQNSNVKIVTDLNDIKDIRFDFIYSKDTIEHVRYLNEHLNIFYILGKPTCRYTIFLDNCPSEGHVYDLHEDTILNKFWLELYKFGRIKMFYYD